VRRLLVVPLLIAATLLSGTAAHAGWSSAGKGTGSTTTGRSVAPSVVAISCPVANQRQVKIDWSLEVSPSSFDVIRSSQANLSSPTTVASAVAGTVRTQTETNVPTGTWYYGVRASYLYSGTTTATTWHSTYTAVTEPRTVSNGSVKCI